MIVCSIFVLYYKPKSKVNSLELEESGVLYNRQISGKYGWIYIKKVSIHF